ncbi:MAG: AAA family ATPase [Spirochaetota bacterium]|nr:AAA family ATPase [Spirochaetota bacterium]
MQIIECIASKPGLFDNTIIELDNRVNIIYGGNDSGKSLLARAIIDTLWGIFPNLSLLNGDAWDNLYLDILFSNTDSQYRFIRDSNRTFEILAKEGSVEKKIYENTNNNKEIVSDGDIYKKLHSFNNGVKIIDFFNSIDITTFLNIAFLPSPLESHRHETSYYTNLKKILIEDSTDSNLFYRNIKNAFGQEETFNFNNPILNEILKTEGIIKDCDKKIQIIDIQNSKIDKLYREKTQIEEKIGGLEKKLAELRNRKSTLLVILENVIRLQSIEKNITEIAEEILYEHDKTKSVLRMVEEIEIMFPQFKDFNEISRNNIQKIEEAYNDIRSVNEVIDDFIFQKKEKRNWMTNRLIIINLFSIIVAFVTLNIDAVIIPSGDKITILVLLLILSLSLSFLSVLPYVFSYRSKELKQLITKKNCMGKRLKCLLNQNNIDLNDNRLESIYELLVQYFEEYGEYSIKHFELSNAKESLKDKEYLNRIECRLNRLIKEEEALIEEINKDIISMKDVGNLELNPDIIQGMISNINLNIKTIKDNIKLNETIIININKDIKDNKNLFQKREQLIEEKEEAEKRLKDLNTEKNSIFYIMELLTEAVNQREKKQLDKLVLSSLDKFQILTDNHYDHLIDYNHISNLITRNEHIENTSPAIIHILLLSIMLSITDFLVDYKLDLPLIIDEPFLFMDDIRINRLKQLLDDISHKRQIIIFTYNPNLKALGSCVEL